MPLGVKLTAVAFAVAVAGSVGLSIFLPRIADPMERLSDSAKRLAAGPKNVDEAKRMKADFDVALKDVLVKFGGESASLLTKRLQARLPSTPFEVHVMDLPRGLKFVEIDTLLQTSDFLLMKGSSETKVFPLPDFAVFDDARIASDQAGPVLVLLGHTAGQMPHFPIIKTYALLPEDIVDETDKMVPPFKGDGQARFDRKGNDIILELSLASMAEKEQIAFENPVPQDLFVRHRLTWKDARYVPSVQSSDLRTALLLIARSLRHPEAVSSACGVVGPEARIGQAAREVTGKSLSPVRVKIRDAGRYKYTLCGKDVLVDVELKKTGAQWELARYQVNPIAVAAAVQATDSESGKEPAASGASAGGSPAVPSTTEGLQPPVAPPMSVQQAPPVADAGGSAEPESPPPLAPSIGTRRTEPAGSLPAPAPGIARSGDPDRPSDTLVQANHRSSIANPLAVRTLEQPHAPPAAPVAKTQEQARPAAQAARAQDQGKAPATAGKPEDGSRSLAGGQKTAKIAEHLSSPAVRLRSGPAVQSKQLDEIPRGAEINLLGQENGWYKVSWNGKSGYVYAGLVDVKKSPAYNTAVVTKPSSVRDAKSQAVAKPQVGDRLVLLGGLKDNKYKVQLADGRIGWLDKSAVDVKVETPDLVP